MRSRGSRRRGCVKRCPGSSSPCRGRRGVPPPGSTRCSSGRRQRTSLSSHPSANGRCRQLARRCSCRLSRRWPAWRGRSRRRASGRRCWRSSRPRPRP
ncbi:hypothetical protein BRADI_5g13602v3 [Brachypodium distachyon]|uniref:Uncharacterized protein n=1 Tax=Brachypodium distachyon TaxID=15368 RepID=A0A0Q3E5P0_BRADI|nr:hypothetical protein BRADI_5g13602v3 [Brachypodium distachyon]